MSINIEYNLTELTDVIYSLYERFNNNYGNLIDLNKVKEAINQIETNPNNFPDEIKYAFNHGYKGLYFNDKIYVKENLEVDVLFHEILHYITKEHGGIKYPLLESYEDDKLLYNFNKYGDDKFASFIEQLDESMTRFITEVSIPEVTIHDAYEYGAKLIKRYYDELLSKGINPNFLFNMYLHGNMDDVIKFKDSFGDNFELVMESIERINNVRAYILNKPKTDVMKPEELDQAIINAVNKINTR